MSWRRMASAEGALRAAMAEGNGSPEHWSRTRRSAPRTVPAPRGVVRVKSPTKLDPDSTEALLTEAAVAGAGCPLCLDMSATDFVDPYGLVALIALMRLASAGAGASLIPPANPDRTNYLAATRFFDVLPESVVVNGQLPDTGFKRQTQARVMPMCRLRVAADVLAASDHIQAIVHGTLDPPESLVRNVGRAMTELCSNVVEHAEDPDGGFAVAQAYDRRYDGKRFVVIAVGDCGLGIKATLERGYAEPFASDRHAIVEALKARTTGRAGAGGIGLPRVLAIAEEHGGRLDIRSGAGLVSVRKARASRPGPPVPLLQGTLVHISLYAT